MEIEVSSEAKDKRLNRRVAVTVVVLSIFTGVCNIKDGNIVQNMQAAQSASVDRWGEYQATRTKLHISEVARDELQLLGGAQTGDARRLLDAHIARQDRSIAKYRAEAPKLRSEAKGFAARYDALNVHDDQFDASEALISAAISIAAIAALVESAGLLWVGWAFGAFGLFMGLCGFAGWAFHPDILSNFLG